MAYQDKLSRLLLARELAERAGSLAFEYFQSSQLEVERKEDETPVTVADRKAEELIRNAIESRFPSDSILGEEFSEKRGNSDFRWIIDPIDGTFSFINKVPLFGTLIAVEYDKNPIIGVMNFPALNEIIFASKGQGCWSKTLHQPQKNITKIRKTSFLRECVLATTSLDYFKNTPDRKILDSLLEHTAASRFWSDCYAFNLLATGRVDLVIEPNLSYWDVAAAIPIIEEAGGRVVDFEGKPVRGSGSVLAGSYEVVTEALKLIRYLKEA